jgi:hypothetical protein
VRVRVPPVRMWATGPSRRRVMRCPANGMPTLMPWLPRLTFPDAFTVRSSSMAGPVAGGSGGCPAGVAPEAISRPMSVRSSRDGRVLIRCPSSRT